MRRLFCWLFLSVAAASATGCLMDEIRRDHGGISRTGVSAKARQIENDLDWSSL